MPRAAKDARLDTPAARGRLEARKKPHYRLIEPGLHVGYYSGERGGSWIGRRYLAAGKYETHRLGLADDGRTADGAEVLTFAQAQHAAREWATLEACRATGTAEPAAPPPTVKDATDAYLRDYTARGGKAEADTKRTIEAHIEPALGGKLISSLTAANIKAWHRDLALAPARMRAGPKTKTRKTRAAKDDDAKRARRSSANRVLTVLKAALNLAYREGMVPTDDAWRRVQPFQKVDTAKVRYLIDAEALRLMNACGPDLRAIVTAALLTGCRYGEIAALQPGDVDQKSGSLTIRASKGGGARVVVLTEEAKQFFAQHAAGKERTAHLFTRLDGKTEAREPWGKSHQFRPLGEACKAAKISPAVSFHILRHTHASRLAMKGVPMAVIAAQLGHADLKMTTKHYAHLSPGYVADTFRAAFTPLGIEFHETVVAFRPGGAAA
jgi:integrase